MEIQARGNSGGRIQLVAGSASLAALAEPGDLDNQNLSHSSNGNDDGAGADAEEDGIGGLKPDD